MADGIALEGLALCSKYLVRATNTPDDLVARGGMAMADLTTISTAKGVAVTALAEIDEGRRKGLKSRFPKANLYADWREMLDKDFAVEVVHLMLQCHGIETIAVNLECLTISVLGLEENTFKAFHFFGEARH